jgi:hypothetical protein
MAKVTMAAHTFLLVSAAQLGLKAAWLFSHAQPQLLILLTKDSTAIKHR